MPTPITVTATVRASGQTVWDAWIQPEHITQWCHASADWHAPAATNDVRVGGRFSTTMAAKDGSVSFNFEGTYTSVVPLERLEYVMDDGRRVTITFALQEGTILVTETFDPEGENPEQMQRAGWQAILDSFKRYVETNLAIM